MGLELVGSIGNFRIVAQLILLIVEHLRNPIAFTFNRALRDVLQHVRIQVVLDDSSSSAVY